MKKILSIFFGLLIFATSVTVFATTTSPIISISCNDSINSEETFDVYVSVTENSGVGGGRITIGYDNSVLEVVSIEKENLLANASMESNAAYTDSSLRVSWAGATGLASGGNLFKITFKAKEICANVSTTITVENMKLTDSDTNVISGTFVNKTLNVKAKDIPSFSIDCKDEVQAGETFDAYVSVTENSGIGGGRITIGYDKSVLEVVSIEKENLLANASMESNAAYTDSSLRVSWAGATGLSSGGNLFKITFKAKDIYANVSTTITVENMKLTDADTNVISGTFVNKTLNVNAKDTPSFYIDCKDEVQAGETFDVNINITDNSYACGGKFNLIYDNTKFVVVSTEFGDILSNSTPFVNTNYENTIKANWAGTTPLTSGGSLLKVTFRALDNVDGLGEFTLQNCKITDNNDITFQCSTSNKAVRIIKCSTETVYCEENGEWKFSSSIKGCPESAILFVALYTTDGKLLDCMHTEISSELSKDVYLDKCDFDEARVFVWESFTTLKPISGVEVIPYE